MKISLSTTIKGVKCVQQFVIEDYDEIYDQVVKSKEEWYDKTIQDAKDAWKASLLRKFHGSITTDKLDITHSVDSTSVYHGPYTIVPIEVVLSSIKNRHSAEGSIKLTGIRELYEVLEKNYRVRRRPKGGYHVFCTKEQGADILTHVENMCSLVSLDSSLPVEVNTGTLTHPIFGLVGIHLEVV